jgi:hypothetical protein
MAASSKPTGVHYALVVFVLISIVCGLGWLLAYKGSNSIGELSTKRDAAEKALKISEGERDKAYAEIKHIKEKLGKVPEDVGADDSNPNTVLGDMQFHIKTYGGGVTDPTYNGMIVKLNTALRDATQARDQLQEKLQIELAQFEQRLNELRGELDAEKKARETSDKGKTDADNTHKEELAKKDADISELRKSYSEAQTELDEYKNSSEKRIKDLDARIVSLVNINKKLSAELDEKTRISFDVPDGQISLVDPNSKKVWINLGDAEGIKPRTTFSVYKKTHSGVGRGTTKGVVGGEDIKGSIEVTRVIEAHLSEARILTEDIYHPMAKGDPIYSPLWSSGHDEAFSVIGVIDLDGDGKDDRDLFNEVVTTAGGTIDNDVNAKGILTVNGKIPDDGKPRMSEKTKFLVIGKIPDLAETRASDPENVTNIMKMYELRKTLEETARERGVRIVSLGDFLSYIGYKAQRRLFVPGSEVPYNLKSGSHSTAVGESSGSKRQSAGTTSAAYSGDKATKPRSNKAADGTSKIFRGGGK